MELYRQNECLWNPILDHYKNKIKKNDTWNEMSDIMNCDSKEVRKIMGFLLVYFVLFSGFCRRLSIVGARI